MPVVPKPIEHTGLSPKELLGVASVSVQWSRAQGKREKSLLCEKIQ